MNSSLDSASILSRLTFWWVTPTLATALRQGKLELDDLPPLPAADEPGKLSRSFESMWASVRRGPLRLLFLSSFSCQRAICVQSLVHGWIFLAAMLTDPIVLNALLDSASTAEQSSGEQPDPSHGKFTVQLGLVTLLSLSMFFRVTCMELCYFFSKRVANNARSVLILGVFRSTTGPGTSDGASSGKLTNLMATDADRIGRAEWLVFVLAQWTWSVASLPAVLFMMYRLLGTAAFVGVGAFIVSNFLSVLVSSVQLRASA